MTPRALKIDVALSVVAIALVLGGAWAMLPPSALSFAGGGAVDLHAYHGTSPAGVPVTLRTADLITRGRYLTEAADCAMCHTREGGPPFAGGRAFVTSFGVLYSPNITADRHSGIGTWSDADFLRAVRQGIAKGGVPLYPAFPYDAFTLLTDADVRAIKAYLFSLPPVQARSPAAALRFPFNQRWLMRIWSFLYDPDQRFRPHPDRTPEWNRGAYLVEGLTHCGECHTPRNLAQALDNRRKFAGTIVQGWQAYDITPDAVSGIGGWGDAQLAQYLRTAHAAGHGSAGGPMAEEIDASLSALSPTDMGAVIVYLRSIPARREAALPLPRATPAADWPTSMPAQADPRGQRIFEEVCVSCHGWSGVSLLTPRATLTGDRAVNDPSALNIVSMVLSGEHRPATAGIVMMPSFAAAYSDREIAAVANYVTARFGAAPSQLTAQDVARLRAFLSPRVATTSMEFAEP